MSANIFAHAEKRVQTYLLKPLGLTFIVATIFFTYQQEWLAVGVFVFLVWYIGWIGANLVIHRNKSFSKLSRGITPTLPELSIIEKQEGMSEEETRQISGTMVHVLYSIIVAVSVGLLVVGLKFYWVFLVVLVLWWLGQIVFSLVQALIETFR